MIGGFQARAFQLAYQQAVASSGAGKPKRKRRYFVEIDGQRFDVSGEDEARKLLARAAELARESAEEVAEIVAPQAIKSLGKVDRVKVPLPKITASPELLEVVAPYRRQINRSYINAAQLAEMRLLMQRKLLDEDDDDLIVLMM